MRSLLDEVVKEGAEAVSTRHGLSGFFFNGKCRPSPLQLCAHQVLPGALACKGSPSGAQPHPAARLPQARWWPASWVSL